MPVRMEDEPGPTFSVIIPTSGRTSLRRTLRRLRRENRGDIEVLVVSDGPEPIARAISREEAKRWSAIHYHEGPRTGNWGNAQRMVGIQRATGRYLMFIDDDDVTKWRAFRVIRQAVQQDPGRIILFRMKLRGEILWRRPELRVNNVSTQMVVVPNLPGKIGSWLTRDRYASDFDFISECVELQGEPIWNHHVIAALDPFRWSRRTAWLEPRKSLWRRRVVNRTRGAHRLIRQGVSRLR